MNEHQQLFHACLKLEQLHLGITTGELELVTSGEYSLLTLKIHVQGLINDLLIDNASHKLEEIQHAIKAVEAIKTKVKKKQSI